MDDLIGRQFLLEINITDFYNGSYQVEQAQYVFDIHDIAAFDLTVTVDMRCLSD